MRETFETQGFVLKKNLQEFVKLINDISDQIDDKHEFITESCNELYDELQKGIDKLIYLYGCQELEDKLK